MIQSAKGTQEEDEEDEEEFVLKKESSSNKGKAHALDKYAAIWCHLEVFSCLHAAVLNTIYLQYARLCCFWKKMAYYWFPIMGKRLNRQVNYFILSHLLQFSTYH